MTAIGETTRRCRGLKSSLLATAGGKGLALARNGLLAGVCVGSVRGAPSVGLPRYSRRALKRHRPANIGSIACGVNELNCTTHGCPSGSRVQRSPARPRGWNQVAVGDKKEARKSVLSRILDMAHNNHDVIGGAYWIWLTNNMLMTRRPRFRTTSSEPHGAEQDDVARRGRRRAADRQCQARARAGHTTHTHKQRNCLRRGHDQRDRAPRKTTQSALELKKRNTNLKRHRLSLERSPVLHGRGRRTRAGGSRGDLERASWHVAERADE